MKINLDEEINTVVDLDSNPTEAALKEGLDSFVLTNSLGRHLYDFLSEYNNGTMQSGVWLSGFYGSGKSYFAQIIGLLLENRSIFGTAMRDRFSVKLEGLLNEDLLRSEIGNLSRHRNKVVSFDASKHNNVNGLPYMIFSSFLRNLGMPDTWHGIIEYDIYIEGRRQEFLNAVKDITGKEWKEVIKSNTELTKAFKPALLAMGYTEEQYDELKAIANSIRKEYDAARLKQDISRYLDGHPETRIAFFIDEVSEAITQKKISLDDLEGVAEALADLGRRVWTIAIAQQRLDEVLKAENVQANSLTKVRDRFRTKIAIEADEVDTIIRHRLLAKEESGLAALRDYYMEHNGIIADVTNIGVASLSKTEDIGTYMDYYPFYKHQFKLLQYFLFGTGNQTQTRVGNRGMIISAFDVLKKEVKNEVADHYHVNVPQLCNQADDRVEESLSNRYRQAEETLWEHNLRHVEGRKLLQTINFLVKGEVHTTVSNITKSYVNKPEEYHATLEEVKKALDILQKAQILIASGEQYRITNEAEQRLLDDMRRFDVQSWEIIQDINNVMKRRDIVKTAGLLTAGGMNVRFKVATSEGEVYANGEENNLTVVFSDLQGAPGVEDTAYVDNVRQETADTKGRMTIIPTAKHRNEIKELGVELRRLKYLDERTNLTDEEKGIVKSLCSERDQKEERFRDLIERSYLGGAAVYCFNRHNLTADTFVQTVRGLQTRMTENVFTKRLEAELPDTLAIGVFNKQPGQLHNYFGASGDFRFFDTSGAFIGTNLSVVTEILGACTTFTSGKDIESKLAGPPTGYSLGTVMTTLAVLFRGDKVIVKFNGEEYTSCRQEGATDAFKSARNFSKASFKAVSKSLSYKQRREIVDILKDECDYTRNTGKQITYQMNDFEIVDGIRTLSLAMINKISAKIDYDETYRRMFRKSVAARSVFQQYQGAVTEGNFLTTAQNFLIKESSEEYITAVERVTKDILFINSKMDEVREMKSYIDEVRDQFEKAIGSTEPIEAACEDFSVKYDNDIVHHFTTLKQDTQEITDAYITTFKRIAGRAEAEYRKLLEKAEATRMKLSQYPKEWNSRLWTELQKIENRCRPLTDIATSFDRYAVKSLRSRLDLREVVNAMENVTTVDNQIYAFEAQIQTTDPNPGGSGGTGGTPPPPPPYQPKTHRLKSRIPQGAISVGAYRDWLTQQLALLNSFNEKDSVNLNE